ncbi:hypothetical protein B0T13DRAFT_507014 [Neurospora crassa]|nr:hypothetical protein B0T13DRAFT_507014 [Neurospora crassa]
MAERDWLDALLSEPDDFDMPPACPFGEEDYSKDAEQDQGDLAMEDSSIVDKSLVATAKKPIDALYKLTDATYAPIDSTSKPTNVVSKPTDETYKPIDEAYEQTNATHITPTDRSTDRPAGVQSEEPEVRSTTLTTDTTSVPTKNVIPIGVTQVVEPVNYHGPMVPDHTTAAHIIHPDPHIVHPVALPNGHRSAESQNQASNQPLLAPIDYGIPCEECKEESIWQPGAARCFDCLGNSPSSRKRQAVIARALLGIWSCSNCYGEADNGAGKHCLLCSQRQVEKNDRARQRRAAGQTWVPAYVQKGRVRKERSTKPKGASEASRKAKIASIKKGLGRK